MSLVRGAITKTMPGPSTLRLINLHRVVGGSSRAQVDRGLDLAIESFTRSGNSVALTVTVKNVAAGRGFRRAESADAAMQYPLTTKKSGTPTQNRLAITASQSASDPPSLAVRAMAGWSPPKRVSAKAEASRGGANVSLSKATPPRCTRSLRSLGSDPPPPGEGGHRVRGALRNSISLLN